MSAAGQLRETQLKLEVNPFVPSATPLRTGRPLQMALGQVIRHIGLEAPVVVVAGSAGTGKTLLVEMASRALSDMGLSVRRIDRGDMVPCPLGERPDVLMIDEADCMSDAALQALLPSGSKRMATTIAFMCLPSSVLRFSGTGNAVIVQLQAMSIADARNYLLDRSISAGRLNLFAPDASDLAINGSNGSPRALRSIAERAFVAAALEGAAEIAIKHVAHALAFHVASGEDSHAAEPAAPPPNRETAQALNPGATSDRPPVRLVTPEFQTNVPQLTDGQHQQPVAKQPIAAAAPARSAPEEKRAPVQRPSAPELPILSPDAIAADLYDPPLPDSIAHLAEIDDVQSIQDDEERWSLGRTAAFATLALLVGLAGVMSSRLVQHVSPSGQLSPASLLTVTANPPLPPAPTLRSAQNPAEAGPPVAAAAVTPPSPESPASAPPAKPPVPAAPALRPVQAGVSADDLLLPEGKLYGAQNTNSHLTLRVHKTVRVEVYGRNDRILLMRALEPGDRYRVPTLPGLTITTSDSGAVELLIDDTSTGFLGENGVAVDHIPLRLPD